MDKDENAFVDIDKQYYIILENIEILTIYKILLDELFEDINNNISFDIDFSIGLIIKKGITIENLINNETVPYNDRRKIEERFNKVPIYIDGKKLPDNKKELMKYFIETHCTKLTKLKDIQQQYGNFMALYNNEIEQNIISCVEEFGKIFALKIENYHKINSLF